MAEGLVTRTLDVEGGHIFGEAYTTADGTPFMKKSLPEFAFRIDGRMYSGRSAWTDVAATAHLSVSI